VFEKYKKINEEECDLAEPYAAPISESLRAFGYELPSAIADLVDNSIYAEAKNVWVEFNWDGEDSTVCVTDDGCGMTERELVEAMRLGSRNPLEDRDPKDLGRFGLGLKTASFSQCRRLVVRSKKSGNPIATRCWDLDFVAYKNKWLLLRDTGESNKICFQKLNTLSHGTTVLWERLDRLVKEQQVNDDIHKNFFYGRIEAVEKHLAMVFHRFMEGKRCLRIFVNNNEIEPWDPFLKSEKATQQIADERVTLFQKQIKVIPYVLPHVSKLTPEKHEKASGIRGWDLHQGFYVYRNERLLVPGDWLGLPFAKEEHFKLARIQLDIPNSMDHEWEIDVTKSKARPPDALRKELKYIAEVTRKRASEVYRHRGKIQARKNSQEYVFIWKQMVRHGKYFYQINREHPLVSQALKADKEKIFEQVLILIEQTIPVSQIVITNSEQPDKQGDLLMGVSEKKVLELISRVYDAMVEQGVVHSVAIERLRVMEPFSSFPELVESFLEKNIRNKYD
jgi:hypothetical protein